MPIYLDNAASTPILPEVLEAMLPYFRENYGNPSSIHQAGRNVRSAIELSRKKVAECINSKSSNIIFTSGGTESNNIAIKCTADQLGIKNIISSPLEHGAVVNVVKYLGNQGIDTHFVENNEYGQVDLEHLKTLASEYPNSLISIMHGNNETGTINDIKAISEIAKEFNCIFHSDTVQTAGTLPLDTQGVFPDLISASAHKFNGPKGVGFLYINPSLKLSPFIHGGGQEKGIRSGTENVAGIVGLAKAFEICWMHRDEKREKILTLKKLLITELKKALSPIDFIGLPENESESLPNLVNVILPETDLDDMLLFQLDLNGLCASGGSACSSGASKRSHVIEGLGIDPGNRPNLRLSVGIQNTSEEIYEAVEILQKVLKGYNV